MSKTILVTGSQGFIGSYLCDELLNNGYNVVGLDNYSKYGIVARNHDGHSNFRLHKRDLSKDESISSIGHWIGERYDYIIAGAAMIGGISYFHKYSADLLRVNNAILNNTFEIARIQHESFGLKRIVVLSSSMVFERTKKYPTPETEVEECPPPVSTYGLQKLCCEYYCRGYQQQYGLPYTIVRPFNCVGVGENDAIGSGEEKVGNTSMLLSHVLPDIIKRAMELGPNQPLPILGDGSQVRSYTNGKDIARGIRLAMESESALNNDFNISSPNHHTVKDLCEVVYKVLYNKPVPGYIFEEPYEYDVVYRWPDVSKAKEILGFSANITLEESVREVVEWMRNQNNGNYIKK